jgi:hypothetical protein
VAERDGFGTRVEMDLILLFAFVIFIGSASWLWQLSRARLTHLRVKIPRVPGGRIEAYTQTRVNSIWLWFQKLARRSRPWLLLLLSAVVLYGIVVGILGPLFLELYRQLLHVPLAQCSVLLLAAILVCVLACFLARRALLKLPIGPLLELLINPWHMRLDKRSITDYDRFPGVRCNGEMKLPSRVYEGDSQNISIELRPRFHYPSTDSEYLRVRNVGASTTVNLSFNRDITQQQYLEAELLSAGLTIEGDKKQRQSLNSRELLYRWNAFFPNSGNHSVAFVFRLIGSPDTVELGTIQHDIKVVKLGGLTQRQVWMLATAAGIISGTVALTETLHKLGLW